MITHPHKTERRWVQEVPGILWPELYFLGKPLKTQTQIIQLKLSLSNTCSNLIHCWYTVDTLLTATLTVTLMSELLLHSQWSTHFCIGFWLASQINMLWVPNMSVEYKLSWRMNDAWLQHHFWRICLIIPLGSHTNFTHHIFLKGVSKSSKTWQISECNVLSNATNLSRILPVTHLRHCNSSCR